MVAEPLTADAFRPSGTVIGRPSQPPDGWSWWAETGALPRAGYAIGYLALAPGLPSFDWAEYHPGSVELIAPLGGECLVDVAPLALRDPLTAMVALARRPDTVSARFDRIPITMED
jgi:hypothetical protein